MQYDWTHGKVQIIAATIAFGMGAPSAGLSLESHLLWVAHL